MPTRTEQRTPFPSKTGGQLWWPSGRRPSVRRRGIKDPDSVLLGVSYRRSLFRFPSDLATVRNIQRMKQRLSGRRGRRQTPLVWGAAYILLGLRHSPALAAYPFRGVVSMKESSTYQAILE